MLLCAWLTVQATAGGGGRGMRLANDAGEFVKLLQVNSLLGRSRVKIVEE